MKKILTLTVILICLTICSCNLDGDSGLLSDVACSTKNTDVSIKKYIGCYDGWYYYLADSGLYRYNSVDTERLESSSEGNIIAEACLDETTGVYRYLTNSGKLFQKDVTEPVKSGIRGLLTNGLYFDENNVYKNDDAELDGICSVEYRLVSNEFAFIYGTNAADVDLYMIVNQDGTVKYTYALTESESAMIFCGFQYVDDSRFILLFYDSDDAEYVLYDAAVSGTDITITDTGHNLNTSPSTKYSAQIPSFSYKDSDVFHVVFKSSSYFEDYNLSTNSVTSISAGYASGLRTTEITNIARKAGETGKFIAATRSSSLYVIDLESDTGTSL